MMEYRVCEHGGCTEDFLKAFIYKDFAAVSSTIVSVIGHMDCRSKERIMRVERKRHFVERRVAETAEKLWGASDGFVQMNTSVLNIYNLI